MSEQEIALACGGRIKALRKEKGIRQYVLARKVFVENTAIRKWEQGARLPKAYSLLLLAEALGTTVQYLLTGEDVTNESNHCELPN